MHATCKTSVLEIRAPKQKKKKIQVNISFLIFLISALSYREDIKSIL